jgi:hypothetical protein
MYILYIYIYIHTYIYIDPTATVEVLGSNEDAQGVSLGEVLRGTEETLTGSSC